MSGNISFFFFGHNIEKKISLFLRLDNRLGCIVIAIMMSGDGIYFFASDTERKMFDRDKKLLLFSLSATQAATALYTHGERRRKTIVCNMNYMCYNLLWSYMQL